MEESKLESWVEQERLRVTEYLEREGIECPNVGDWPAFEVAPYFGIWAVESKKAPGKIGWWAFSGECPTDYISGGGNCNPREALEELIRKWRNYIPHMKAGRQPPNIVFGPGADLSELGSCLERIVPSLEKWREDDEMWEE